MLPKDNIYIFLNDNLRVIRQEMRTFAYMKYCYHIPRLLRSHCNRGHSSSAQSEGASAYRCQGTRYPQEENRGKRYHQEDKTCHQAGLQYHRYPERY